MKRGKLLTLLLLATFIFILTASLRADQLTNVPYWWRGRNFTGRVTAIDKDKIIVLDTKNNVKKKFEINSQTRIFLRDEEKIKIGMYIKIVYKETKQVNIARAIREVKQVD